jgi:hypothetical protein
MITFALHGYEGVDPAFEFGPLQAEFERRGVRCIIVRSARTRTSTPNRDRAKVMVEALREIEGEVALIGISNQGLFMPLVAAVRPIKRIVYINAAVPRPGKSFWETAREERVFASIPAWWLAWVAPGMHEVCSLDCLPKTECVYISAQDDEASRTRQCKRRWPSCCRRQGSWSRELSSTWSPSSSSSRAACCTCDGGHNRRFDYIRD